LTLTLVAVEADAQSLSEARERRQELQARLDAAAQQLDALETRRAELEAEETALADRRADLESTVSAAQGRIADRVRSLYKRGSTDPIVILLTGGDPDDAIAKATTIRQLVTGDRIDTETAGAAAVELQAVAARLDEARQELADAVARQEELTAGIEADLEEASALEARLVEAERRRREEAERRRREREAARAAAAREASRTSTSGGSGSGGSSSGGSSVSSGGMACPVDNPRSFTDTWGAPRSGGRRHQGTDILAPRGQTVRAIVSGVWDVRSYGASAGNWAILRGNDGNNYYYMHLERHTVGDGARVSAGQQTATNGDTGNARGTTPHVHFEIHPGGGAAVNPYPTLRRVCG
jgi:peptidoglycan LD-endopeptidase LytH